MRILQRTIFLLAMTATTPLLGNPEGSPYQGAAVTEPVRVTGGLVSGVPGRNPSVVAFKGIPYAAPPVLDRRWKAPGPAAEWEGVRTADKFGASCIQNIVQERKPWTFEFMTHGEISEDCLYVNIWTAAKSPKQRRPVFVYIYGGGFSEGSGAVPVYAGAARFGAFHSSEVPYVLNTLYTSDRPFTEADRKIAEMMSSYWANFAAAGDPNGRGLPRWDPVGERREVMEVGDKTVPVPLAGSPAKFAFFEKFLTGPGPLSQSAENYRVDVLGKGLWRIQAIKGTLSTAYLIRPRSSTAPTG